MDEILTAAIRNAILASMSQIYQPKELMESSTENTGYTSSQVNHQPTTSSIIIPTNTLNNLNEGLQPSTSFAANVQSSISDNINITAHPNEVQMENSTENTGYTSPQVNYQPSTSSIIIPTNTQNNINEGFQKSVNQNSVINNYIQEQYNQPSTSFAANLQSGFSDNTNKSTHSTPNEVHFENIDPSNLEKFLRSSSTSNPLIIYETLPPNELFQQTASSSGGNTNDDQDEEESFNLNDLQTRYDESPSNSTDESDDEILTISNANKETDQTSSQTNSSNEFSLLLQKIGIFQYEQNFLGKNLIKIKKKTF